MGERVDAFKLILTVEDIIRLGKLNYQSKVTNTDSFKNADNVSYLIDYECMSTTASGGKSRGSIYIRGVQQNGIDSYKFVMEKGVDFCDLDS